MSNIHRILYPDQGRIRGQGLETRARSGGRNGVAYCRGIEVSMLDGRVTLRPITSVGLPQSGSFIDIPAEPDLVEQIGRLLLTTAKGLDEVRHASRHRLEADAPNAAP